MSNDGEKQRNDWIVRSRAWISILLLVPFVVVALLSTPLIAEDTPADFVLDIIGWSIFSLGAAFRWWATLHIGGRKHLELITDGPYSICRNPLYFGTVLLALSIAFFLHSVAFGVGLLVATIFYLKVTVSYEESQLEHTFGQPFLDYCARVPQFLPSPWLLHNPEETSVRTEGLYAESLRALCWMWIPVLADAVAHLRMGSEWPHYLALP